MIDSLIARLEAGTEKDERGLIREAGSFAFGEEWVSERQLELIYHLTAHGAPLQAALILVPKGWYLADLGDRVGQGWKCRLMRPEPAATAYVGYNDYGKPATSALALCIADLKAWQQAQPAPPAQPSFPRNRRTR